MKQLIRVLKPQLRAQQQLGGCLEREFDAQCRHWRHPGWHL